MPSGNSNGSTWRERCLQFVKRHGCSRCRASAGISCSFRRRTSLRPAPPSAPTAPPRPHRTSLPACRLRASRPLRRAGQHGGAGRRVFHQGRKSGLWATVGPGRMRARGLEARQASKKYYRSRNLLKTKVTTDTCRRSGAVFPYTKNTDTPVRPFQSTGDCRTRRRGRSLYSKVLYTHRRQNRQRWTFRRKRGFQVSAYSLDACRLQLATHLMCAAHNPEAHRCLIIGRVIAVTAPGAQDVRNGIAACKATEKASALYPFSGENGGAGRVGLCRPRNNPRTSHCTIQKHPRPYRTAQTHSASLRRPGRCCLLVSSANQIALESIARVSPVVSGG